MRLSGGVVITTYAAAAPAVNSTTFATVRAAADVMPAYPRDPPPECDPPDCAPLDASRT